jgi:hypothetical protein
MDRMIIQQTSHYFDPEPTTVLTTIFKNKIKGKVLPVLN